MPLQRKITDHLSPASPPTTTAKQRRKYIKKKHVESLLAIFEADRLLRLHEREEQETREEAETARNFDRQKRLRREATLRQLRTMNGHLDEPIITLIDLTTL